MLIMAKKYEITPEALKTKVKNPRRKLDYLVWYMNR